jgi:hypothetical protein
LYTPTGPSAGDVITIIGENFPTSSIPSIWFTPYDDSSGQTVFDWGAATQVDPATIVVLNKSRIRCTVPAISGDNYLLTVGPLGSANATIAVEVNDAI